MSLLSAMPGLSVHDTPLPLPTAPVVVSFDNFAAQNIIRQAITDVALAFPAPDPWGWLVQNRPEIISELKRVGNDMNAAYMAADLPLVTAAADTYVRYHKKAWLIYEQRPPVIEVQGDLL